MTDRVPQVVEFIAAAARRGDRCPRNSQIAQRFGFTSTGHSARLVRYAEIRGLIRVQRANSSRIVTAGDGSWRTAGEARAPHWRERARP